jgi:hypothetical protein
LYVLGGLFVLVTLFLPKGIIGAGGPLLAWLARRRGGAVKAPQAEPLKQEGT